MEDRTTILNKALKQKSPKLELNKFNLITKENLEEAFKNSDKYESFEQFCKIYNIR